MAASVDSRPQRTLITSGQPSAYGPPAACSAWQLIPGHVVFVNIGENVISAAAVKRAMIGAHPVGRSLPASHIFQQRLRQLGMATFERVEGGQHELIPHMGHLANFIGDFVKLDGRLPQGIFIHRVS